MSVSASITYVAELDILDADTQVYGMVGVGYDF
jgi:hypothetical protein